MRLFVWAAVVIAAIFVLMRFRNGATASGSFQGQVSPSGWGSGMIYAPGSATGAYPYGYPWGYPGQQPTSYAFGGQAPVYASGVGRPPWYAYLLNAPINVGYQNGGFGASYGS